MACRVAIIGGGPGGLMTAYLLQQRCQVPVDITIYEASGRLGGKIVTERFAASTPGAKAPVALEARVAGTEVPAYQRPAAAGAKAEGLACVEEAISAATYEAGAAELYDYSVVSKDPLRELVRRLGLTVKPMGGRAVVLDGQVLNNFEDVGRVFGEPARRALEEFDGQARQWMSPAEYYDSDWDASGEDPMASRTFAEVLEQVPNEAARRYLRTMVHSDLATEPEKTSAAYGLQNYLMNDPAYMRLYAIEGGNERLAQELAAQVEARVLLQEPVTRVERQGELLRVSSGANGTRRQEDYDFVVVALPHDCLTSVEWAGEALGEAMHQHIVRHDHPAHYLRVSVLFREIFWKDVLGESYMMLDAFGGCCLYDESSRNGCRTEGVLSWLLAGDAAVAASEAADEDLIRMALDSLPTFLQRGRETCVEGRVHRWIGAVSGLPAGSFGMEMEKRHIPEAGKPNLLVVGDYLFDATLNGVLDSADYVTDCLVEEIESAEHGEIAVAGIPATTTGVAL